MNTLVAETDRLIALAREDERRRCAAIVRVLRDRYRRIDGEDALAVRLLWEVLTMIENESFIAAFVQ